MLKYSWKGLNIDLLPLFRSVATRCPAAPAHCTCCRYLHNIYTIYTIYTVSPQYLLSIQYLHSIYISMYQVDTAAGRHVKTVHSSWARFLVAELSSGSTYKVATGSSSNIGVESRGDSSGERAHGEPSRPQRPALPPGPDHQRAHQAPGRDQGGPAQYLEYL